MSTGLTFKALVVPDGKLGAYAKQRRVDAISEAISWPGQQASPAATSLLAVGEGPILNEIWGRDEYVVYLAKPGKEAVPNYTGCRDREGHSTNNPNDMLPCVYKNGVPFGKNLSFGDIFDEFFHLGSADSAALELMGCLLFRAAFMLDHKEVSSGEWRYFPPPDVVAELQRRTPQLADYPIDVFLHLLEAISWNEDVKYHTLGYEVTRNHVGRVNNLLTCVHLIAVHLRRVKFGDFAAALVKGRGVGAIGQAKAREVLPGLTHSTSSLF